MITVLSERRHTRMRRNILKGVLDENQRVLGRRPRGKLYHRSSLPGRILLTLSLAFLFVLLHGSFFSYQWFPEGQIRAGLMARQTPDARSLPGGEESSVLASEQFEALVSNNQAPLWRLLGMGVKTIMIDAGHGGIDSGAIGTQGTMEKDLVLDIALRLKRRLEIENDYRVVLTRETDIQVPLRKRVEMAHDARADIFISIHLNYLPQKPINIIETFYFGPSRDVKTARLAEAENAGSEIGLNNFKQLVEKINDELKLQESHDLAAAIQGSLYSSSSEQNSEIHDYGIKQAPFVVLLDVDVPSVLVEVSCLSNVDEERKLNTELHRENIARYLETGILEYLEKGKGELQYDASK